MAFTQTAPHQGDDEGWVFEREIRGPGRFPCSASPFSKILPGSVVPEPPSSSRTPKKTFNNGTFMNICKHWLMDEMLGRHRHDTTKPLHNRARSAEAWRDFAVSKSSVFHIIQKMLLRHEKRNQSTRLRNHLYSFIYLFIYIKILCSCIFRVDTEYGYQHMFCCICGSNSMGS